MAIYILRRLALMVPTLIGMTFILFAVIRFAPGLTGAGDVGSRTGGSEGSAQSKQLREEMERARLKRLHMVDEKGNRIPLPMQYTYWLWDTVRGDLGQSVQYHVPVSQVIGERLPTTLALNLLSTCIVYMVAIPGGMLSAAKRGKGFDVIWSVVTLALYSLPAMWIGALLVGYLANPQNLAWFPPGGLHAVSTEDYTAMQYAWDYLWHLVLPLVVYTYGGFAFLSKQMRASILDNLGQDYVRTAWAKGLPGHTVMLRHVLRNSLLPMITIFGGLLPSLLAGSLVVEMIFSIEGMGRAYVTAAGARDLPMIQGIAFVGSVLSLVSLLMADIGYALADPRVSYD